MPKLQIPRRHTLLAEYASAGIPQSMTVCAGKTRPRSTKRRAMGRPQVGLLSNLLVPFGMAMLSFAVQASASSLLLWPMIPSIESDQRATAVWLENKGTSSTTLQVRVLGWKQDQQSDNFDAQQKTVAVSPPLVTIEPGKRQLLRLVRVLEVPEGQETAFRILIDELPEAQPRVADSATSAQAPKDAQMGVQLRMRYSLPLFVHGKGLRAHREAHKPSPRQDLQWKLTQAGNDAWIEVQNNGQQHARLTAVDLEHQQKRYSIAEGLLGYVLAGKTMRWRVTTRIPANGPITLHAKVNGTPLTAERLR